MMNYWYSRYILRYHEPRFLNYQIPHASLPTWSYCFATSPNASSLHGKGYFDSKTACSRPPKPPPLGGGSLLERLSYSIRIIKLPAQPDRNLLAAISRRLGRHPQHLRKSSTYDNGVENVEHMLINKVLSTQSHCCEPYHSWENGAVENDLSLIRRFLPKITDFDTITKEQLKQIETLLNNRHRKCLSF